MNRHNLLLAWHAANEYGGWANCLDYLVSQGLASIESVTNNLIKQFSNVLALIKVATNSHVDCTVYQKHNSFHKALKHYQIPLTDVTDRGSFTMIIPVPFPSDMHPLH